MSGARVLHRFETLGGPARELARSSRDLLERLVRFAPAVERHALARVAAIETLAGAATPWAELASYEIERPVVPVADDAAVRPVRSRPARPGPDLRDAGTEQVAVERSLARTVGPAPRPAALDREVVPRPEGRSDAQTAERLPATLDREAARGILEERFLRAGVGRAFHSRAGTPSQAGAAASRAGQASLPIATDRFSRPVFRISSATSRSPAASTDTSERVLGQPEFQVVAARRDAAKSSSEPLRSTLLGATAPALHARPWQRLLEHAVERAVRRPNAVSVNARTHSSPHALKSDLGSPAAAFVRPRSAPEPVEPSGPEAAKPPEGSSGLARLVAQFQSSTAPLPAPPDLRVLRAERALTLGIREPAPLGASREPLRPTLDADAAGLSKFEETLAAVLRRQLLQGGLLPPEGDA
jgi:hypothetical protein